MIDFRPFILIAGISFTLGFMQFQFRKTQTGAETVKRSFVSMVVFGLMGVVYDVYNGIMLAILPPGTTDPYETALSQVTGVMTLTDLWFGTILVIWAAGAIILFGGTGEVLGQALRGCVQNLQELNYNLWLEWWVIWTYANVIVYLLMFVGAFMASLSFIRVDRKGYWVMFNALNIYMAIPIAVNISTQATMLLMFGGGEGNLVFFLASLTPFTMPAMMMIVQATMFWLFGAILAIFVGVSYIVTTGAFGEDARIDILGPLRSVMPSGG